MLSFPPVWTNIRKKKKNFIFTTDGTVGVGPTLLKNQINIFFSLFHIRLLFRPFSPFLDFFFVFVFYDPHFQQREY